MDLLIPNWKVFIWVAGSLLLLFVLYTLYHIFTHQSKQKGIPKLAWALVVLLMPLLGSFAYFLFGWRRNHHHQ